MNSTSKRIEIGTGDDMIEHWDHGFDQIMGYIENKICESESYDLPLDWGVILKGLKDFKYFDIEGSSQVHNFFECVPCAFMEWRTGLARGAPHTPGTPHFNSPPAGARRRRGACRTPHHLGGSALGCAARGGHLGRPFGAGFIRRNASHWPGTECVCRAGAAALDVAVVARARRPPRSTFVAFARSALVPAAAALTAALDYHLRSPHGARLPDSWGSRRVARASSSGHHCAATHMMVAHATRPPHRRSRRPRAW